MCFLYLFVYECVHFCCVIVVYLLCSFVMNVCVLSVSVCIWSYAFCLCDCCVFGVFVCDECM